MDLTNRFPVCYHSQKAAGLRGACRMKEEFLVKKVIRDKKSYNEEFLQALKATARECSYDGLTVTEKHAPDMVSPIALDPRVLNGQQGRSAKVLSRIPNFLLKKMGMKLDEKGLASFRESCDQIVSAPCVTETIDVWDTSVIAEDGYAIPVRIYRSEKCEKDCQCLLYLHGGGFIGGGLPPYDEALKFFVEKFHMVVVSVDYRLMPENPYPIPFEDCYRALLWVHDNAGSLGIDKEQVFVSGDSAGGTLAQYCATRSKGTGLVRGQLLLYAALNIYRVEDNYYKLDGKNYTYEPSQKRIARGVVKLLEMTAPPEEMGFPGPDAYSNPYTFEAAGNPPTFISVGAFDFLKNDNIAWAHKLRDAGVEVKVVVYNGMGHGYLNAVGHFPQAEDLLDEMGTFILSYSK